MTLNPATGNSMMVTDYKILVTWLDDAAYLGLMVYVYNYLGIDRIFLPIPEIMFTNPVVIQALRYGLMFGSMLELRRWLESIGIKTDLVSYYLDTLFRQLL